MHREFNKESAQALERTIADLCRSKLEKLQPTAVLLLCLKNDCFGKRKPDYKFGIYVKFPFEENCKVSYCLYDKNTLVSESVCLHRSEMDKYFEVKAYIVLADEPFGSLFTIMKNYGFFSELTYWGKPLIVNEYANL